jgi:ubiquinone/menaquinone biosynthesis C-methylase UbiE
MPLDLAAMDVSVNAVRRAAKRVTARSATRGAGAMTLIAGSAVEIPFANESFDIVVASDGLYSWDLSAGNRAIALAELRRVLGRRGRIIFTEHTRFHRFDELAAEIAAAGFEVEQRDYLYDRPWYQLESWTRAVQSLSLVKAMRRNVAAAQILRTVGRVFGPRASRHICFLARRRGS